MNESLTPTTSKRALALDALRGFAIITMILSGRVPYGVLPGWMYHVQVPPPLHKFDPSIPGISWVDLVFPFFLFAMGAAFPLALSGKLQKGASKFKITLSFISRGLLLAFFAIVLQHFKPYLISSAGSTAAQWIGIIGFLLMFLFFMRYPNTFSKLGSNILKYSALAGIIALLYFAQYPKGGEFSFKRFDIIILVLANVAVAGGIIWMITANSIGTRVAVLALLLGIRLSYGVEGSYVHDLSKLFSSSWLFNPWFLKYLFIVLPGTIAGDLILKQFNSKEEEPQLSSYSPLKVYSVSLLSLLTVVVQLVGLYNRWLLETVLATALLCMVLYWLTNNPKTSREILFHNFVRWGSTFLLIGLAFEPFEGGIKKDHSTLSYYFVTSGLAFFTLLSFTLLIDVAGKKKYFSLFIENGQNPMIAYVAGASFIYPLLTLTYVDELFNSIFTTPWLGALRGLIVTLITAGFVMIFTRKKIFWRT